MEILVAFLGWLVSAVIAGVIIALLWAILFLCGIVLPTEVWIVFALAVGLIVSTIAVGAVMG